MEFEICARELDSDVARELILALNAELVARYQEDPSMNHFRLDATEVAPGRGAFLVAYAAGLAVGCGAVRRLEGGDAEIKRMYVRPEHRSRGVAGAVLAALEARARELGASRLVLETGVRQPEALALYRRAGFEEIPCFGEYQGATLSVCMAKQLH